MAVAGMTSDGRHRSIDHPKVLRTPPGSPGRVRASYHTPGTVISVLFKCISDPCLFCYFFI